MRLQILDFKAPSTVKDFDGATAKIVEDKEGATSRTAMEITIQPGFDWRAKIGPKLPNCPKWCPANLFGFLKSGIMNVEYEDGSSETVKAGDTYYIRPGHIPKVEGEAAVMVEFSQSTKEVMDAMKKE